MRHVSLALAMVVVFCGTAGCSKLVRKSSLLLERPARGPLAEVPTIAHHSNWHLDPETQTQTLKDIEVSVTHATDAYLLKFFSNRDVFGEYAGTNPYYPVHLVFYVKIANRSGKKIFINPAEFVLVDDRGNQYHTLGQDYVTAFAESRQQTASFARDLIEDARPGYFGISVPVGKFLAQKPMGRFALLLQSALKTGPLFEGSIYDGLVAFWSPSEAAKTLRLYVTNIKTDFDASDFPKTSLEFPFEFHVASTR